MSKLRVCVEWSFGDVLRHWKQMDMKMKIQQTPCAVLFNVAVLLTNCITMIRGQNTTSIYYGINPPLLNEYFEAYEENN